MQVTIILIVIGTFGTVIKGLLKGVEDLEVGGRVETKLQHYWERPEYREESWRLEEICCHSNSSERPSASTDVKNSNEQKIIIIMIITKIQNNRCWKLTNRNVIRQIRSHGRTINRKCWWEIRFIVKPMVHRISDYTSALCCILCKMFW